MPIRIKVDLSKPIDVQAIMDELRSRIESAFDNRVGPHVEKVARERVPVGKERNFNPQTGSFQSLKLKPLGSFGPVRGEGSAAQRLQELHGLGARERSRSVNPLTDAKFFQGTGKNAGKTPDIIERQRGTIRGAFAHKPGTLRDSIKYIGTRREGDLVVGLVEASAPYAAAIHDGFVHRGGRGHSGKSTQIPGDPYLATALTNAQEEAFNASTYEG